MMQYKVPQDVLRADKIVGFLTLRQLIIVILGGGTAYALYMILNKQYFIEIWLPPVLFVAVITIAFAFIKFHDILFERLIFLLIEYSFLPRSRAWKKTSGDVVSSVLMSYSNNSTKKGPQVVEDTDEVRRKKLEDVSKLVDLQGKTLTKQH